MRIKASLEKVPGGFMVIPMFFAAIINTFAPGLLRIGGFTEALFVDGVLPFMSFVLLATGAQINLRNAKTALAKGFTFLLIEFVIAAGLGLLAYLLADSNGLFFGLAPLAILAAMTSNNGLMYLAIAKQYGKNDDVAAFGIMALNTGPLLTMVALSIFGTLGFTNGLISAMDLIGVLLPSVIGILLGNLDEEMRELLGKGVNALIPFMAFSLGMSINLEAILKGGLSGVFLGLLTVFLMGGMVYLVYKALGWNPIIGFSTATTGGNAVATPAAIAAVAPIFAETADIATVQVAAAAVTTGIVMPIIVAFLFKRGEKPYSDIRKLRNKSKKIS